MTMPNETPFLGALGILTNQQAKASSKGVIPHSRGARGDTTMGMDKKRHLSGKKTKKKKTI